mgnify:CR=1 FL=1
MCRTFRKNKSTADADYKRELCGLTKGEEHCTIPTGMQR